MEAVERSQVVAVGTPLPTASLPVGAHQGPVMVRVSLGSSFVFIIMYI